jgi:hypothetical protein
MVLNPVHKIDKISIDSTNAIKYALSISLRINGFCFIICDNKKVVKAANYIWQAKGNFFANTNVQSIISSENLLKNKYKSIAIFFENEYTTLIPSEYYSAINQQSALDIYLGNKSFVANAQKLKKEEAYLVFGIEKTLLNTLKKQFFGAKYYHHSAFAINNALDNKATTPIISLRIGQNSFEIIASDKGKLLAHNNFDFKTIDEFLFLLLSFVKQQGFDISEIELNITGQLLMTSEIGKKLKLYFANIKEANPLQLSKEEAPFSNIINNSLSANN